MKKQPAPAVKPAPATVSVDGTTYTIFLDFNRMCDLEEAHGISLRSLDAAMTSPKGMRAMLGAGLIAHHGDMEPAAVGDIIFKIGMVAAAKVIASALAWMK